MELQNEAPVQFNPENKRKELLTFWVEHKDKRHYHNFNWDMIWVLVKHKLFWGNDISFTVTKHVDCEKYTCSFYTE